MNCSMFRWFPGFVSPWLQCLFPFGLEGISLPSGLRRGTGKPENFKIVGVKTNNHCCRVYELYTSATGLYLCLVIAKGGLMLASWIRQVKIVFVISILLFCYNTGMDCFGTQTQRVGQAGGESCDRGVLVDGPCPPPLWPPS